MNVDFDWHSLRLIGKHMSAVVPTHRMRWRYGRVQDMVASLRQSQRRSEGDQKAIICAPIDKTFDDLDL